MRDGKPVLVRLPITFEQAEVAYSLCLLGAWIAAEGGRDTTEAAWPSKVHAPRNPARSPQSGSGGLESL